MRERAITEDEVEEVLMRPQEEFYDISTGYFVAVGDRRARADHRLFVICERRPDVVIVISVIDTSSPERLILRRLGTRWLRISQR